MANRISIPRSSSLLLCLLLGAGLSASPGALSGCSGPPEKKAVEPEPEPPPAPKKSVPPADLVLIDGDLYTIDPDRPKASALAVRGTRIVAVGERSDIEPFIGKDTEVLDLKGASASPGLTDAHCHLYGLGLALDSIDLRGLRSPQAVVDRIAEAAAGKPEGTWLVGRGWDQNLWDKPEFPTGVMLDTAIAKHPVAVRRVDGHALWANRAAMKRAGINKRTKAPAGGLIVRDRRGRPTGVFVDSAMALVSKHIPGPTPEVVEQRILKAADQALAAGITTVHDMGISDEVADVYRELAKDDRLPIRVYAFLSGNVETALTLSQRQPDNDQSGEAMFVMRAMKLFADGALGSRGAALLAPYSDAPESTGLWVTEPADLKRAVLAATDAGWQVGVHAIGDAGNRAVLDAFEAAIAAHSSDDLRLRVEHAQVLAPEDISRFAKLDVIASMQPTHATSDMPWAEERLGKERISGAYAWRALLDSGARIAGGSDFPVEKVSPILGIHAAVNRTDERGEPKGGWYAEQTMELEEAIDAFTHEAAYASFVDKHRGLLKAGFVADITIFDRKLAADNSLREARVARTIIGGKTRYSAK